MNVHTRFEEQAAARPAATALALGGETLTYGELNARANRLAHALRDLGARPGVLVGVCLDRSFDLVTTILAILKSGAAYVPFDPHHPEQRIALMLDDSGVPLLLTDRAHRAAFAGRPGVHALEDLRPALDAADSGNPGGGADGDDLAYVIYTSGSTGRPKGVRISHHNVRRLFTATDGWFGFAATDVWTLFHSPAFDLSVWEMWGALAHGGRLVVVPHQVSRSFEQFHDLVAREGVTMLTQTPTAFKQFQQADRITRNTTPLRLRFVIFAGEALDIPGLRPWFDRHGDATPRLVNMYGITETTVHATYREITLDDTENPASLIGTPIPDLRLHILDEDGKPVAIGETGEIHVSGDGVGQGYLGRPDLTAERFLPSPFPGEEGQTLYRSGDLAIPRHDGDIEYVGRADQQVKIRGFRVELGEIEQTLAAHPAVRDAVVAVRDADTRAPKIVAYLVADGDVPSLKDVRRFAARLLPDYMLPNAVVPLAGLPLTANGKLDRAALP
ncbi:amino acid adenylation domain-containing protein [Actinomadura rayongensis]|uniref:Amino acid adenylation domain-containing protein n=1 Tax=Actinomadura rayongensis TaxID=1429076 RepID=A0A6I4WC97_9ACTN|nr:amino acid adenylation domain-containing protein [Actinomadura rayongensis]MXQ67221.1 amino acid adenylation domain-containing protein [Actinomadura rayongensis]